MRRAARLVLTFLLVVSFATPSLARMAAIETIAPLADQSTESIETALKQAIQTAVRGAVAMGLPWVQVNQAVVFIDAVIVKILASDMQFEAGVAPEAEAEPEPIQPVGRIDI